uniref:Uncharacterized protein n=1 Tax=Aegilops tauschii subsp. strangulata TaxID=200361 RepID=A0A453LKW7_AEGTS
MFIAMYQMFFWAITENKNTRCSCTSILICAMVEVIKVC